MPIYSVWFYLGLMALYVLLASALAHFLPFFRQISQEEQTSGRQLSIDGLRGMLALGVFFLHAAEFYAFRTTGRWAPPPSNLYSQLGVVAVTMFFFITGYVFWAKLSRHAEIPAIPFFYARLGRLGPAYAAACLWLFCLTAAASSFHRNVPLPVLFAQGAAWLSFVGSGHEINAISLSKVWLGPAWTLRCEWYFYLSLPFLGWFARKRLRLLGLLGVGACAAWLLAHLHRHGITAFLVEAARTYALFLAAMFSVGMLAATLKPSAATRRFAVSGAATLVSLGLITIVLLFVTPEYGYFESAALGLPFLAILWGNTWFGLLTCRPVLFLGRISYSFYLLHLLTLASVAMAFRGVFEPTHHGVLAYWAFAGGCGALAIVLAAVSYRFLEHPFLNVRLGGSRRERGAEVLPIASPTLATSRGFPSLRAARPARHSPSQLGLPQA